MMNCVSFVHYLIREGFRSIETHVYSETHQHPYRGYLGEGGLVVMVAGGRGSEKWNALTMGHDKNSQCLWEGYDKMTQWSVI